MVFFWLKKAGFFVVNITPPFFWQFLTEKFKSGKRIEKLRQTLGNLDILGIYPFVVIIPYGHFNASALINEGVDAVLVSHALGHATVSTTDEYLLPCVRGSSGKNRRRDSLGSGFLKIPESGKRIAESPRNN